KREYHSIRQTNTETSTEFMQRFLLLVGFLGTAAGTEEEQAKNFQWGFRRSTLNHLMCMSYTDVAQVANADRNYEILHERDDDDAERPDNRQKSSDRHQPTSQQSSHRNHDHNNDRQGSDRRGGGDNHRSSNNNYSGNNRNSSYGRDQRNMGQQSNRSANFAGHLQRDCKKNTTASTSGQADKKSGASGHVFAITEDHATKTPGKSMQIIFALQERTLLSHGCEGFLATIHDTTSDVPFIRDQPIVSEFPDVFPDELPGIPPVEFRLDEDNVLWQDTRGDMITRNVVVAYNNSWHASIKCAPFEMLYGRKYHAQICWDQVGERVIEGPEMIEIRADLSYVEEPEAILDHQDRVMRKKTIPFIMIL
nr:hypothetical protein [Tanacetum cinerariifolium]